ncbi:MAG: BamA/TamA family outer membrane protein, partial [Gemmatimonadota bacterium]|nr:BamA/TamA family outer membrane protein [Gemmatimonadota bacterium]
PIPFGLVGSLEGAVGTSAGTVPVQGLWYLGGPGSVRGYPGATAAGKSFWRARGEVATRGPGARLATFMDAGWAGERSDWSSADPSLLAAGVGASFLDGLIRADLARALRGRTGWRLDVYLDAAL